MFTDCTTHASQDLYRPHVWIWIHADCLKWIESGFSRHLLMHALCLSEQNHIVICWHTSYPPQSTWHAMARHSFFFCYALAHSILVRSIHVLVTSNWVNALSHEHTTMFSMCVAPAVGLLLFSSQQIWFKRCLQMSPCKCFSKGKCSTGHSFSIIHNCTPAALSSDSGEKVTHNGLQWAFCAVLESSNV